MKLSQETINRRTAARRFPWVHPVNPACGRCHGTGTLWRMGRPSSHPKAEVTVQETKRAQVRYPSQGRLDGSSVSWDRVAEGCQRPVQCPFCRGTGEITAERLLQLLGQKRRRRKKSRKSEELAKALVDHLAETADKT